MNTHSLSTRVLAMLLTLVMAIGMLPMTALAADPAPVPPEASAQKPTVVDPAKLADGKYTANASMLHETKDQPSMCNIMFDSIANVEVKGNNAAIKLLVANPVPSFSDQGTDGTVKNVKVTYSGKTYDAVSQLNTGVKMTAKDTNSTFGFKKGEQYTAQVLTVTLPKAAMGEKTLPVDAYVNVVMMTDVVFRLKLDGWKKAETETPAPTDPTEVPTTASTEAPTTAPTEVPTTASTEAPTTASTEAPTTAPTEAPTTAPTEAPALAAPSITNGRVYNGEVLAWRYFDKNVFNLDANYIKIDKVEGATEYYYLASLAEVKDITPEKVVADGVSAKADTFVKLVDKAGKDVDCGYEGGTVYIYAVAKSGKDISPVAVPKKPYVVAKLSLQVRKMEVAKECGASPYEKGTTIKVTMNTLPKSFDVLKPVYTYTVNGGAPITLTGENPVVEIQLTEAKEYTIVQTVTSDVAGADYTSTQELKVAAAENSDDMTLIYGEGKTQNFSGALIHHVGTFMTENKITEATLKLNKDITADQFTSTMVVPAGVTFTLDLNGHNMTTEKTTAISSKNFGTKITVTDTSTGEKKGTITSGAVKFGTTNTVTVGQYASSSTEVTAKASLTINNGVTLSGGAYAYFGDLNLDNVTILDGAVGLHGDGKNVAPVGRVKNCTIHYSGSYYKPISVRNAKLYMENDTVTTKGTLFEVSKNNLIIESGTYTTTGNAIAENAEMIINGGQFNSAAGGKYEAAFQYCSLTFKEGMKMIYKKDHWELTPMIIVDQGLMDVTPVGGETVSKTKVLDAFAAIQTTGGTIQLTGDSSLSGNAGIILNKDVVLDLNGYTLTMAPELMMNKKNGGAIDVENGGGLTIKDSSADKTGKLDLSATSYGITLCGTDADFTLESGTIAGSATGGLPVTIMRSYYDCAEPDYIGNFLMSGGKIIVNSGYGVWVDDGDRETPSSIVISGGEIAASGSATCAMLGGSFTIKGNTKLTAELGSAVYSSAYMCTGTITGNVLLSSNDSTLMLDGVDTTISGNVQILNNSTKGTAIFDRSSKLTLDGNVKVESTGKSAIYGEGKETVITINGGMYKLGENTMFLDQTADPGWPGIVKSIEYKADETYKGEDANMGFYIIGKEKNSDGYYTLVKRQDAKQNNAAGQAVGYQNFENLDKAMENATNKLAAEGEGDAAYTPTSKQALVDIQTIVPMFQGKASTSQLEIDFLTAKLNQALSELQTVADVDPSKLADGVYTVNVQALRAGDDSLSMSAGALAPTATLIINGDKKELHVTYKPMALMGLNGHLVRLWAFDGSSAAESLKFARSSESEQHKIRCEATGYYTVTRDAPLVKVPADFDPSHDYDAEGIITPTHFPDTLVVPVRYMSAAKGEDRYVCHVCVDAMGDMTQDVDIQVLWGTAKKAEQGALMISTNKVTLEKGETKTVTASMVDGSAITTAWKSGNERVATVENGKIVAVGGGTTKIAVTAEVFDHTFLRVIDVTVNGEPAPTEPVPAEGWNQDDKGWFYVKDGETVKNDWVLDHDKYSYMDENGYMLTGWQKLGSFWFRFDASGFMQTGWQNMDGKWYLFDIYGHMQTGWQWIDGIWFKFDNSGVMQEGWQWIDGFWYFFNGSGHMQEGWMRQDGFWYLFDGSGHMQEGWQWRSGVWYKFDHSGHMQTGWQWIDGEWYKFDDAGHMQTGWQWIDGLWYFFNGSGHMLTGTQTIDGVSYTFNRSGALTAE